MAEYRYLDDLPSRERNAILDHANRIPTGWDFLSQGGIQIPTLQTTAWEAPINAAEPYGKSCMLFEIHRVRNPKGEMGSALVANGNVIVDWRPKKEPHDAER